MSLNDNLWNLGTAPRGLDGDTARDAGEKYNNHKHPPVELADQDAFNAWIADEDTKSGDTSKFNGILYMWDGNDAIPLGIGPGDVGQTLISEVCLALNIVSTVATPSWEEVGGDQFDPRIYNLARADRSIYFKAVGYMVGVDDASIGKVRLYNMTTATSVVEFEISSFNNAIAIISDPLTSDDGLRNTDDIYAVQLQVPVGKEIKLLKASLLIRSELG